jgi:hypothetical protein
MTKQKVILATLMLLAAFEGRSQAMEEQEETRRVAIRYRGPGLESVENDCQGYISIQLRSGSKSVQSYNSRLINLNNNALTQLPDLLYGTSHTNIQGPCFIIAEKEGSGSLGANKLAFSSYLGKEALYNTSISIPLKNTENHPLKTLTFELHMEQKQNITSDGIPSYTYYIHWSDLEAQYEGDKEDS